MNVIDQSQQLTLVRKAGSEPTGENAAKLIFIALNGLFVCLFFRDLLELAFTAYRSNYYSYILFIPFISGYLLYLGRESIFSARRSSPAAGIAIVSLGLLLLLATRGLRAGIDHIDDLAIRACVMVIVWIGIFTLCHGLRSLRIVLFPVLFLFFAVPLPNVLSGPLIFFLQSGSTEVAHGVFKMMNVPMARDGFLFYFPDVTIEVTKQCSGIRSGLALIITGLLAAKMFLKNTGTRSVLISAILPIAMFKNGLRIATLSILGAYWDKRILDSDLHHKGGILFFILAIILLGALLVILKKYDKRSG